MQIAPFSLKIGQLHRQQSSLQPLLNFYHPLKSSICIPATFLIKVSSVLEQSHLFFPKLPSWLVPVSFLAGIRPHICIVNTHLVNCLPSDHSARSRHRHKHSPFLCFDEAIIIVRALDAILDDVVCLGGQVQKWDIEPLLEQCSCKPRPVQEVRRLPEELLELVWWVVTWMEVV